jgi:exopolysaccharide production protein ExoZ
MYFRKLQVLRGLAALAVVLYHVHEYLLILSGKTDIYFNLLGVQFSMGAWFFFVLGGFLMSYLIDTGSDRFLIRRLVRIYPTYWLAVLARPLRLDRCPRLRPCPVPAPPGRSCWLCFGDRVVTRL